MLLRWNRVYNLTAIRAPEDVLTHHLLDSLAIVGVLRSLAVQAGAGRRIRVLDVGSGAGLPGIPLAIACEDYDFTLIDTVRKKTAYLTQVVVELRMSNVAVRHGRVESLGGEFDLITSRAFAALADFVDATTRLLAPQGRWLAMKGRLDPNEVAAASGRAQVERIDPLVVPGLDEERNVIVLRRR